MEPERSEVIATTPPRPCCMEEEGEEDVSQASSPGSGTHVSSVSGFSLGEAIVQRAKQGTELWSQLHSGPDTGELTSATAARVLAAGPEFSQTLDELPTMEEGTITFTEQLSPSSESGQFQSPQMFEMQDSALSPALALVTACSTQHLHSDLSQSFFHRSPLEFAPLRAAPDLSVVSQEGGPGSFQANNLLQLLISEVSADCVRGSLSLSRDGSEAFLLSQHPLSPEDDHFTHADSYLRDQRFMELPSRPAGGHTTSRGGADPQLGPPLGREGVEEEPQNQTEVEKPSGAGQSGGCPGTGAVPEGDGQRAADLQGCGTEDGESSGPLWNPEASDGTVPLQGQPVDRTDSHWDQPVDGTVQLQGQPVDGMVPLQGQPVEGTVPLQGQPVDGTVPHWCQPVDRTDSHWGQPVDGTVPHWGQPVDGMVQLQGQPVDRTDSHWGQPVDGTVPLQGQPAVKTSPVSGRVASSQPLSEGSLMCSNGQAVGPGPGSGRVTSGTGSPTPDSSKNDTAIEVLPGRGDVGSGAGQEDGLSPAPVPAQPDHRSTPESAVENAPSAPGPARRGAGHQRVPLAPVFAGQDPTAGGASQPPPSHVKEGGACSPGQGQKGWPTFDSLVLHGLRGVAPRQQAYLAVADSLNRMLARANRGAEGRESPERASPCTPSPHPPDRHTAPLGSSSDRGHSPALLSPPDSTPSDRQGPETGGRGWSSLLTPPSPYQLTAHQLDTTSTDDGLLPPGSSLDTSRAAEHTLTMSSHSLTSLEVDNYVPAWAPSTLTPEPNHFCIDDRIQVYLRNLGISQSPSSILASQGPDREAEFNHAELRELSEEALQEYQGEEGVSALDRDSGSAFYSNVLTHSVSIGLGSAADSNSPDHTHPWLGIEEDRGVEAADSRCHSGYAPDPRASSPLPAHDLSLTGDSLDENRAPTPPDSAAAHRSGGFFPGLGAPGLSPAGRGAVTEPPLPSEGGSTLRHRGDDPYRRSDSFVGSDTLSEIRKLLGEAAHISAWRPDPRSPAPDRLRSAFPASFQWDGSETDPETDRARHPGGSFWLLPASRAGPEGATLTSLSSKPGPDPAEPPPPTSQPFPQPGGAWAAASGTKPNKSMDGSSRTDLSSDQLTSRTRDQSPVRLTRSRSPATPEMDPRAQGWERTKGSRWPLDALSILDEEDRRKIDEIKAELLQNSKTSTSPQETWWARAEDSSLKSDPSSSADPGWLAHPLATLPSLGTARLQPQSPAGGAMDRLGELVPGLSTCQLARPIAAITFSSRRKPSPTTPQPSSTSPTAPQPSSLQPSAPQPSSASYSAPLPSSARSSTPLPTSLPPSAPLPTPPPMEASSSPGPAHSPEAGLGGEKGRWPWGDPWLVGKSCSPLRSPTRTVVSHVRVTLSPNRPDTLGTPPSPLRTSRLTDTDVQWSGPDPGWQPSPTPPHPTPILPPHPSAPAAAHTGPPYPPLPMPVPAFCPSLPLLFERPSVAPTPEAGQTPGRDGAGQRLPAVKGGSKVDVSTQTSGLGQSPPPSAQGQAQGHDSTEETPSGTAPRTTGTTSVSGQAGNTDAPLMLPYKPAGSSELFYVASAGTRRGIGRGDSESSSDVYRPDRRDAPRSAGPPHAGRSRGYCSLRAGGEERGESGAATTSYQTRGMEDRGPRRPRTHPTHRAAISGPRLTRDPGGVRGPGVPRGSVGLAELWQRFSERRQSLGSSTASELSLLERLDRLARLLEVPHPGTGSLSSPPLGPHHHGQPPVRGGSSGSDSSGQPASSSSPSTIDTARLVRAFGAHRVLPLARLYSSIQRQREGPAQHRGNAHHTQVCEPPPPTLSSTTSDCVTAWTPRARSPRRPSVRLVTRKGLRLVDQGVQAGSLEIVPEATRRHTRDVGVTFPSPDSDVSLHHGGRPRERTDPWSGDTGRGSKLGNRPSKRHPAVAWYIPAVELQEDWRKENVPERRQRWGRAWGRQEEAPRCWREPLRQRQLQEAWTSEEEGRWGPGKTLSSLIPLSLGDALSMKRPWFISHSRERVRRLALLKEERKFQSDLQSERDRLFNRPSARGHPHRGPQPDDPVLYKKRISRQEMWDRSKRLYEQLPEVTRQKEEAKRRSESRSNRLRAQLYKQKITNRVLGRKVSWQ